ncbi:MAG TPA: cupin domain-containing protein [Thermoplasmatales archaeon]|nr:cupin domain-containing protein [Thermoplasmatales archaeon]
MDYGSGVSMEETSVNVGETPILIRKGEEGRVVSRPGRLYRLLVESRGMKVTTAELDPHSESKWFQHDGEEVHIVLEGELEYTVGETVYNLKEGDILWHKSTSKHKAKNPGDKKVVYITIGTPPTFQESMI